MYLTTNYDRFMTRALETVVPEVATAVCRWNYETRLAEQALAVVPTPERPLVYHLHGVATNLASMLLTEDDYVDFLMEAQADLAQVVPCPIQEALGTTSLLFVGYGLNDWNFRVLLRSVMRKINKSSKRMNLSVQLPPGDESIALDRRDEAEAFLCDYLGTEQVTVYWGDARRSWPSCASGGRRPVSAPVLRPVSARPPVRPGRTTPAVRARQPLSRSPSVRGSGQPPVLRAGPGAVRPGRLALRPAGGTPSRPFWSRQELAGERRAHPPGPPARVRVPARGPGERVRGPGSRRTGRQSLCRQCDRQLAGGRTARALADHHLSGALSRPARPPMSPAGWWYSTRSRSCSSSIPTVGVDRGDFFSQVQAALDQDPLVHFLFVLRDDYLAWLRALAPRLRDRLATRYHLAGLGPRQALEAVVRPLAATGRVFAPGSPRTSSRALREQPGDSSGRPSYEGEDVEPVQLQIVCRTFFERLPVDVTEISAEHVAQLRRRPAGAGRVLRAGRRGRGQESCRRPGAPGAVVVRAPADHPGPDQGHRLSGRADHTADCPIRSSTTRAGPDRPVGTSWAGPVVRADPRPLHRRGAGVEPGVVRQAIPGDNPAGPGCRGRVRPRGCGAGVRGVAPTGPSDGVGRGGGHPEPHIGAWPDSRFPRAGPGRSTRQCHHEP